MTFKNTDFNWLIYDVFNIAKIKELNVRIDELERTWKETIAV
jgi:hypothetical protein